MNTFGWSVFEYIHVIDRWMLDQTDDTENEQKKKHITYIPTI